MRRPLASAALAALSLLLLLPGCTGDGDDGSEAGGTTSTAATATTTTTTTLEESTTTLAAAAGECGLHGGYPSPWDERPAYRASLDVDPVDGLVEGRMEATFVPPEPTDQLVFRLWANMPRAGSGGGRIDVTHALVDGDALPASYEHAGAGPGTPGTVYRLDGDFPAGDPVDVSLRFTLRLPGAINERVAQVGTSLRLGSVLPMLSWVRGEGWHTSPAVANFSEAVASEVADYDVSVTVPEGFTVLATGEEVEPGRFVARAVRDWAATVGRLRLAEGTAQDGRTRVVVGVDESAGDDPQRRLDLTLRALDDFARRYGPYPYPVLTVGVTGALSGGIEFPQHIHLGAGTSDDHLIHEVAHMWFYGLVGNDQYEHPWLDEGLTEYAETRFIGNTASARRTDIPAAGRGRLGASHDHWQANSGAFYRGVYIQGAQALAALGDEVGGLDAVDCALRRYVLEHAYEVARPPDLVAAVEAQTGVDPTPVFERFGAP